ncbi:MAG: alpha/beta fold hydrolase [Planctomycetaceae bacterium]|nr:alpha/beta fold hydrolase [Planctomycetaceae bacterium]
MPLVPIADNHLNVEVTGNGPPLLFVHGFPLDGSMWRSQAEAFSATHTVIVPDLRGFGRSDVTTGTVTMARFADDLAEMLDELGVTEPVCLCGLSMGGYVAFEFERRHRTRLSALVLCDTRAIADSPEAKTNRFATAERVLLDGPDFLAEAMIDRLYSEATRRHHPELVAETQAVIRKAPRGGVAAASRGMAERREAASWLGEIEVPAMVVVGEHDVISPPEEMEEFSRKIPHVRFVCLSDAGHMSPEEQPRTFNAALRDFLSQ